jgi:PHD/YefM family antitoxin component YafN of YafNO toxin-antitoxin module
MTKKPLSLFQARYQLARVIGSLDYHTRRYLRCVHDHEPKRVLDQVERDRTRAAIKVTYWKEVVRTTDERYQLMQDEIEESMLSAESMLKRRASEAEQGHQ